MDDQNPNAGWNRVIIFLVIVVFLVAMKLVFCTGCCSWSLANDGRDYLTRDHLDAIEDNVIHDERGNYRARYWLFWRFVPDNSRWICDDWRAPKDVWGPPRRYGAGVRMIWDDDGVLRYVTADRCVEYHSQVDREIENRRVFSMALRLGLSTH